MFLFWLDKYILNLFPNRFTKNTIKTNVIKPNASSTFKLEFSIVTFIIIVVIILNIKSRMPTIIPEPNINSISPYFLKNK